VKILDSEALLLLIAHSVSIHFLSSVPRQPLITIVTENQELSRIIAASVRPTDEC